jgi:hypothetical protein
MALWASMPPGQSSARRRLPFQLPGRLTLQEGFNRAFRLSALMSSASRQRPRPSRSPDHADDGNNDRQDGPVNAHYLCR